MVLITNLSEAYGNLEFLWSVGVMARYANMNYAKV